MENPSSSPSSTAAFCPGPKVRRGRYISQTRTKKDDELRVDVEDHHPSTKYVLNYVSGRVDLSGKRFDFVAKINNSVGSDPTNSIEATLVYQRLGNAVTVNPGDNQRVTIVFSSNASNTLFYASLSLEGHGVFNFRHVDRFFSKLLIEVDGEMNQPITDSYDPASHPIHPASVETLGRLTISQIFTYAGFKVGISPGSEPDSVPTPDAPDGQWSDATLHESMEVHWDQFRDSNQWGIWIFFAGQHEAGESLGGIMFDYLDSVQRQGCAIFNNSFISRPPSNEALAHRAAWTNRMRFWCAIHEAGHCLNLAHAFQKAGNEGWVPLKNNPTAMSFMNYPNDEYWEKFEWRFIDEELLFLRHAPRDLVEPGNKWWLGHGLVDPKKSRPLTQELIKAGFVQDGTGKDGSGKGGC